MACAGDRDPPALGEPTFYRSMAASGAQVDAGGGGVDDFRLPQEQRARRRHRRSDADEARGRAGACDGVARPARSRRRRRGFSQRIAGSGYDAKAAYENIGAGYHTLAEAFSGWRGSPGHRANMLRRDVTHIGIAAAYAPRSKYKVFWALILASPDDRKR